MKRTLLWLGFLLALAGCARPAQDAPEAAIDSRRGQLLYETACVACHTTQAHWRDRSIVNDYGDLIGQVTRWQAIAGQSWSAAEIRDVAAYLNQRFYRLAAPERT